MFDFDTPREAKRFRVNHPNGYIEINVGTFFGTSPQKKVNKLLRLARKYCTEDQRKELLCNIVEEAKYRSDILDELDSLISKGQMLFHAIFGKQWPTDIISASGYNAIDKQRKQLSAYAEVIAGERWEG